MARIRSVDFLPEIFQTPTTKKFLNSTLDQLIQEPKLKQTQGYIGRRNAPGKSATDGYVIEPTDTRTQYQLEPGVIFKDENGNTVDALTYIGLIDGLATAGANVENHDRLFASETYSWSPFIDFDKFVNYSQYYWLPNGPSSVNVSSASVFLTDDFEITATDDSYAFEDFPLTNPVLTVLRGGMYTFNVDQDSAFWIQAQPGVDGVMPWAPNVSSRDVLGVTNNGDDVGTITFDVPLADAQEFYHTLTDLGPVDLATTESMASINNQPLATVAALLGLQNVDGKTIVFLSETDDEIYRLQVALDTVTVVSHETVVLDDKITILYGEEYSNIEFYNDGSGFFVQVPLETASLDTLYYQDGTNPDRYGIINVVDQESAALLDVNNIIGQETYTSPNGVEFTNGLKVKFRGEVTPVEYTDKDYYVEGVGNSIRLVANEDLVVPEAFSVGSSSPWDINPWDSEGWDDTLNAPVDEDYITINRSSLDLNAWTRSNRWFHLDVIKAAAEYNGTELTLDNDSRAKRPIIEFDPDMRLFNFGTRSKQPIAVIDFSETDALSNVNGLEEYTVDGYDLAAGSRVIFANDDDPTVRDKIFVVQKIDPDLDGITTINLVLADDADSDVDDMVILTNGLTQTGLTYRFDGTTWLQAQIKSTVNQPPLFDIYDTDGNSFNDATVYPSTTFNGTKLFSYKEGTGSNDIVLGFPLSYLNIDNLGDIVFDNNLYTDTFLYVRDNVSEENTPISTGSVRKYSTRTEYVNEFGWDTSIEESRQAQIFDVIYDGEPITLDVLPATDLLIPAVTITANGAFVPRTSYTVTGNVITLGTSIEVETELQIKVISDDISTVGYYEVPSNLESNIFNENTSLLTLGTVRNHYSALVQNLADFTGDINGANNVRDLGDISKYGTLIVQQSSPVALAAMFLRRKEYNFFASLNFVSQQYEKFKNQLIDWVEKHDVYDMTPGDIIDAAIKDINVGKTSNSAFYWSDMLPSGEDFETTTYTVTAISTDTYTTLNTYDFSNANSQGMLVYHNGTLLLKDLDYTVATDGPRITLLITTAVDDVITIVEYNTTVGTNVPSTPTKLGLYPKFRPLIFTDDSYINPTEVIRGHDGSITVSFGKGNDGENDIRDLVLLEFEKRVYNNIKVNDDIPLLPADIIPGEFRETDYTGDEIAEITSASFLSWVGWNRIDYKKQDYQQAEEKTWNYITAASKLTGEQLTTANWRGIYLSFYDTDAPHLRPWEMLGFTERPDWWDARYGTTPYTSGNLVLWDDLEAGIIRDPAGAYVNEKFVRPGLTDILPVDSQGDLLMPLASVIGNYTQNDFKRSWTIGDNGPAEAAWRKSSAWPFAIQRLYALTKPAQYFSLMADRDRYAYDTTIGQYLYDGSSRLDARTVEIQDTNVIKHSYINWITNYNRHFGYESVDQLKTDLSNLDVNLCHHMASFTDKNNLKIFTDKSSPDSTNSSLLLPDESFNLLLYKNQPVDEIVYSAIVVQKVDGGYSVTGNSSTDPYFKIQSAVANGKFQTLTVGRTEKTSTTVRVPLEFTDEVEYVPYGAIFTSKQAVSEFIVGYNQYLINAGMQFNTYEGSNPVDWTQMVQEFIYWAGQGWAVNSIINLNPAATVLEFERELHIVDDLNNLELTEQPLNQNRQPLDISDYVVDRLDNNFKMRMLDGNIISYLKFNLTSFEHLMILDNTSIFNDLIYDPVTGVRQQRVKLAGFTTYEWNGQLDAQGFMYNEDNVQEWSEFNTYNKGDIIKFKNAYWSAAEKIQPSDTFDFSQWVKTDYDKINKGLLPNLATKSDQMLQYYNNKTANLESDIDLLAFGLTGFRSRDYLRSLDLDDISQVNIYSDMIANKGTANSLNLFQGVTLNKEVVDYTIFENWALRRARYGATSNRNYIELQLDEDKLAGSPSLVEVVDGSITESVSDQIISVDDIYKQSIKNTTADIFPMRTETNPDTALPTAGYVNPDDIDYTVFDIAELNTVETVDDGTLIWVAKDTETDWNVYRVVKTDPIIIKVNDNLNGTLTLETDIAHNLVANDTIVIQDVDELVNGTTKVLSVFDGVNIVIDGELAKNQTCILSIEGVLLKFESARVDVPSDIAGSIFDNNINISETVWVENDNGRSATYKKIDPFALTRSEDNPTASVGSYAHSIAQGYNGSGLIVGAPGDNLAQFYNKVGSTDYAYSGPLSIDNPAVVGYGSKVALMDMWGAVSAPGDGSTVGVVGIISRDLLEDTVTATQLLVSDTSVVDDGFGSSIAMSQNESWIYVGEPKANRVHAFEKVDYQIQSVDFVADGISQSYDISNDIVIANENQVTVVIDNMVLDPTTDYDYIAPNIVLTALPAVDTVVSISRTDTEVYDGDNIETTFAADGLFAFDGAEDSLTVTIANNLQVPGVDYNLVGNDVVFTTPPPVGSNSVRISIAPYRHVGVIDGTAFGAIAGDRFGEAIDASANGSTLIITAPGTNSDEGAAYMIDRIVERFIITDENVLTYTTVRTPTGSVLNNSVPLVKEGLNTGYEYNIAGNAVTLEADVISIGDFLDVNTSEFKLIQKLSYPGASTTPTFGNDATICKSKCSVYVGAENDLGGAGSVTRFVNESRMVGAITSTVANPVIPASSSIRINNVEVTLTASSTSQEVADTINAKLIPNVTASANSGFLTIELVNKTITSLANKLDVLPGETVTLETLGLDTYYVGQTITSPVETEQDQNFGSAVTIDLNLNQLVVAAKNGDMLYDNTYTADTTLVDADSSLTTDAVTTVTGCGVVYTYDVLPDEDIFTPGALALGQQFLASGVSTGDEFGNAISLVDGVLVAGSINYNSDIGRIVVYNNPTNSLSWTATTVQNDTVDVDLINAVNIYNGDTLAVERYLDYVDPLNGKILGAAQQNIDLITTTDPTVYNNEENGLLWGREQVGMIWWDISTVRFLDYNLGNAKLSSKLWGKIFNGSSIDVYQWVESSVPPASYTGTGTVYDADKYVTVSEIDRAGSIKNTYFFWVNKVETISVNSEKTLSASAIASYIESPASSGISYAAFVAKNIVALYNCKDVIFDTSSILYVEYDQTKNSNNVFVEYDLFRENYPTDFLSDSLYKKLQDSLCGIDDLGNLVPDPKLNVADRYGIEFRPRKSMFVDRYAALTSYMEKVNGILAEYTIAESRTYPLLSSEEPLPTIASGTWDEMVATYEELTFQDISTDPTGYRYLVEADETTEGLWTIYEVQDDDTLLLVDIQGYDTKRFWNLEDWYAADYDIFSKIDYVVNEVSGLSTLVDVENNAVAKVLNNSVGSWEIHQLIDGTWERVGLENGTIQFEDRLWNYTDGRYGFDVEVFATQKFDEEPVLELRQIIKSINEELLIGNLAVERNKAIMSVFNYVLAEQPTVDWLYKTSMIDVNQKVRDLAQYAVYQKDNQDYLTDYITEAKPYHTKVKDFTLSYDGIDIMEGQVTDFDCPSVFNEAADQYISPILDDGNATLVDGDPSNTLPGNEIWQTEPWKQWYENYRLSVADVAINDGGSGYTIAPRVVITGDSTTPAEMTAVLGLGGVIAEIRIDNPGAGYLEPPVITFEGGDGTGAEATARMQNTLVRTMLTTIKYDRYEYQSKVAMWDENNVTSTRNLVFKYDGTLQEAAENNLLLTADTDKVSADTDATTVDTATSPVLYRVTELYDPEVDDNTVFDIAKFEAVPYIKLEDGSLYYTGLDDIERKYLKEGVARWYQSSTTTDAGEFIVGREYTIVVPGTTDFTLIGAADNDVGTVFIATGVGTGTGVARGWTNENDNSESRNFVRYNNKVYKMITFDNVSEFLATKYEEVEVETLAGIDRTTGYYVSDVNNPGLDLSLLIKGIAFPGVEVDGDDFEVTEEELDAIYESEFLDTYLGTNPTDINIDGAQFIDTLHSHAPEELVPCSIFDTLDIKVTSRPGSDYLRDGHAFNVVGKLYTTSTSFNTFSFADMVEHPIRVLVADVDNGKMFYEGIDFTVDWQRPNMNVVFNAFAPSAAQFGNSYFAGAPTAAVDLVAGFTYFITTPGTTDFTLIGAADNEPGTEFVATGPGTGDGTAILDGTEETFFGATGEGTTIKVFAYEIGGGNQLHRGQYYGTDITGDTFNVPVKEAEIYESIIFVNGVETAVTTTYVDNQTTAITLPSAPADTDYISATIMGFATPQYQESYPVVQTFTYGTDTVDAGVELYDMYKENAIVEVNGLRLRPPEGTRVIGDGVKVDYLFPATGGILYDSVTDNEVSVYVNGEVQVLNTDYTVSPASASAAYFGTAYFGSAIFAEDPANVPRWVTFATPPAEGDIVNVYVRTDADYWWTGTEVDFNTVPDIDDTVAITTFKDDSELDILTQVFKGPTVISTEVLDEYASGQYDTEDYDFQGGSNSAVNLFNLTRVTRESSLWVTVNGERIHAGAGYEIVNDNQLLLTIPVIADTDVVAVTSITDNIISNGVSFRLFKDMRDNIGMYKMAETYLTEDLLETDDIIYVADASVLGEPDLNVAKFGILMVNGERITYRERDTVANTVSGLRRGTAGTALTTHTENDVVTDTSASSLVPWDYDKIWYEQGTGTASDGVPLQDQETVPALFIKT